MNIPSFLFGGSLLATAPVLADQVAPPLSAMFEVVGHGVMQRGLVRLFMVEGKPRWKQTSAGYSSFSYQGEWLAAEYGPRGFKATYVYGWDRRLVGILYQDGTSVLAQYNRQGMLDSLTSCRGRVVRFGHPVTPRSAEFHEALAQLAAPS